MNSNLSSSRHRRRAAESGVLPLQVCVERTVRFEEVDSLSYMWHGRYASWLEDGREAFGKLHQLSYLDFFRHGVATPVKLFHLDFCRPLLYAQTYSIHVSLLWNEAAVLDFAYVLKDRDGSVTTTGYTTQLMLTCAGELLLEQPAFYKEFCAEWRQRQSCKQ
ncbi:MAG: acyl-CoA thioesterase [Deltaproteobacteria bacterium]|jgi:acyl-CoA thioester hydrolase|nr:acyl-CoA thioesterase [Deltaproteobacteria bacterium]